MQKKKYNLPYLSTFFERKEEKKKRNEGKKEKEGKKIKIFFFIINPGTKNPYQAGIRTFL